jgi:thermostable 8-oxoguanine DNA glycosylase
MDRNIGYADVKVIEKHTTKQVSRYGGFFDSARVGALPSR